MVARRVRWLGLSLVLSSAAACGDPGAPAPGSASAAGEAGSAEASSGVAPTNAAPWKPGPAPALFEAGPLALRDLTLAIGTPAAPRDLAVRATADVATAGEGRVELPIRVACAFGARRVVTFGKLVPSGSERVSLEKVKRTELAARPGLAIGWLGGADRCEVTVRVEPIGKAKQSVTASEEKACFEPGAAARGACPWGDLAPAPVPTTALTASLGVASSLRAGPKAPAGPRFTLHDLAAERGPDGLALRGHLASVEADPARAAVRFEATCGDAAPARELVILPDADSFHVAAGESFALAATLFKGAAPAGPCRLSATVAPWDTPESAELVAEADLGSYCLRDAGLKAGACE